MSNPNRDKFGKFLPGPNGTQLPEQRKQRKKELVQVQRQDPAFVEAERKRSRDYYQSTYRDRYFQKQYRLTAAQVDGLVEAQGGKCACCRQPLPSDRRQVHVDHDHATGVVRGVIDGKCNRGIGNLGDTFAGVLNAVVYLQGLPTESVEEHF